MAASDKPAPIPQDISLIAEDVEPSSARSTDVTESFGANHTLYVPLITERAMRVVELLSGIFSDQIAIRLSIHELEYA